MLNICEDFSIRKNLIRNIVQTPPFRCFDVNGDQNDDDDDVLTAKLDELADPSMLLAVWQWLTFSNFQHTNQDDDHHHVQLDHYGYDYHESESG